MVIRILDHVRSASNYEDGDVIFKLILDPIRRGERVILSFSGISSVPSAFINASVIRLMEFVSFQQIRNLLAISDSTKQINDLIRRRFDFLNK